MFLFFINRIFSTFEKRLFNVIYILFVDKQGFIISDGCFKNERRPLGKVGENALEWSTGNTVIYDISKI